MNILVFRNSSLGDFLQASPALYFLKKKYQNSKIYYLSHSIKKNFSPLNSILNKKTLVDDFIFFYDDFRKIKKIFELIKILKSKKINKFYYLNEYKSPKRLIRDYIFFRIIFLFINFYGFFNIKYRNKNQILYLSKKIVPNIEKKNILDLNLKNLINKKKPVNKTKKYNFFVKKKYITVSVGGKNISTGFNYKSKKWSNLKWIKLINLILNKYSQISVVITGTKDELNFFSMYKSLIKNERIINVINKTNINELAFLINNSCLHLCHDDGSMHLSSLLKKKTIAIFHNHDFIDKAYPISKNTYIFRDKKNINGINIYDVMKQINKSLS